MDQATALDLFNEDNAMICFLDKTFCASPHCKNKCGSKMTKDEERRLEEWNQKYFNGEGAPVAYSYFCGEPKEKGA